MILRKGLNHERVKALQSALRELGYDVTVDGDFGPATEDDVKDFQKKSGLHVDGVAGPKTISAIETELGKKIFGITTPKEGKSQILISAGHGGRDNGVVGNGFVEGKEAVKLRDRLAEALREKGKSVVEDGPDGKNYSLRNALKLARNVVRRGGVAVEFHFNGSVKKSSTGVEVLADFDDKVFAQELAVAVSEATGLVLRGETGFRPHGYGQHHRLAFIGAGGIIVEVAFISNPNDMKAYQDNFDKIIENLTKVLV